MKNTYVQLVQANREIQCKAYIGAESFPCNMGDIAA